ncbi:MAG: winged helix DNA-binding domain-containing protein [Candidatus Aminicenantes bacterium]|nr:winged helix DNA-binding domain-containing protein [Candidatus Aminicenantes bacterium]
MAEKKDALSLQAVNRFILAKQHLSEDSKIDDIVRITRDIGGLHATSATTPYLSLLARTNKFAKENLQKELFQKKSLAKVTYVRKTVFIIPEDMLSVAFSAVQKNEKNLTEQHLKYLQLTQKEYEKAVKRILGILKNRGLTLNELKAEIGAVPNLMYIVRMMCFQGFLIRGAPKSGWKSSLHTYFPFNETYPEMDKTAFKEKEAQQFVIKQYISNYGPVTEGDITWWTGFSKSLVREILGTIQDKLSTIKISGLESQYFILSSQENTLKDILTQNFNTLNILPCLDPYLMGYKNRDRYIDQKYHGYVYDLSGNATTTILHKGRVIGIWDFDAPLFKYFLFFDIKNELLDNLKTQGEKIGRFISGKGIKLKKCDSLKPLAIRTAGGVLSPLIDS